MKKFFIFLLLSFVLLTTKQSNFSLATYFDGKIFYVEERESVRLNNYEPMEVINKLNGEIHNVEILSDGTQVISFYSPAVSNKLFERHKTNLQLSCYDDYIVLSLLN